MPPAAVVCAICRGLTGFAVPTPTYPPAGLIRTNPFVPLEVESKVRSPLAALLPLRVCPAARPASNAYCANESEAIVPQVGTPDPFVVRIALFTVARPPTTLFADEYNN
ncbi:hypothetical protein D3C87_1959930 [compost metagenome]